MRSKSLLLRLADRLGGAPAAGSRIPRRLVDLPGMAVWRRGVEAAGGEGWAVLRLQVEAGAAEAPQAVPHRACLSVARVLASGLRDGERLGRDEQTSAFVLALPPQHPGGARIVAEHMRALVRAIEWRERDGDPWLPLRLSVGATLRVAGEPLDEALARAAQALTQARLGSGRQGVAVL